MNIKICNTKSFSAENWNSYTNSFNSVFKSQKDVEYFKHKYSKTHRGFSYHAILQNEKSEIVGGCTVIPMNYKLDNQLIEIGQAVDVFIDEGYRKNPFILRDMYNDLKDLLIDDKIKAVMAVPNKLAFPFWTKIVKWKYIGDLDYWLLPLKLGNIKKSLRSLDIIFSLYLKIHIKLNLIVTYLYNQTEKKSKYELLEDHKFRDYRYTKDYTFVQIENFSFYYKTYTEGTVITTYLLDANENNIRTYKSLIIATQYIQKKVKCDLIAIIGHIKYTQLLYWKVPKRYHPKRLTLTCDILESSQHELYSEMLKIDNWNYGLRNFDVR